MEQKPIINFEEFQKIKSIKHRADLNVDDIVYLGTNEFRAEDCTYHIVTVDWRCGKDEFAGERHDGKRVSWCDNDRFKII